jgi:hypothetical protein
MFSVIVACIYASQNKVSTKHIKSTNPSSYNLCNVSGIPEEIAAKFVIGGFIIIEDIRPTVDANTENTILHANQIFFLKDMHLCI